MKSLDTKLRIARRLTHLLQLIEERSISVLRRDVERRGRQSWVNGGRVAQILLRNLPGIGDDLRISADVAQESIEGGTQENLIRGVPSTRRTQARQRRSKVLPHPGSKLNMLLRR